MWVNNDMIALNKLSGKILENAVKSRRVGKCSRSLRYLLQATVHLGDVYKAEATDSSLLPHWSEREVAAADTLCWLVAYFVHIGCRDIERLVKDVVEYRDKHPDVVVRKDRE